MRSFVDVPERASTAVVFAAIIANATIAALKFTAAIFTGSSAMISEGIHSLVDTGDGLLLRLGTKRSKQPPDDEHPFGHGQELYVWTLMVAVVVFAVGGGMSVYEGITHLLHPRKLESVLWSYLVLGGAAVAEGISWVISAKAFWRSKRQRSVWQGIRATKDPTVLTVLLEDSAALAGLTLAFLGTFLAHTLHASWPDAASSIAIGILLMLVALVLARESVGLLVGEAASQRTVKSIRALAEDDPNLAEITKILTVHFGPEHILATVELRFRPNAPAKAMGDAVERLRHAVRAKHPEIKWLYIGADAFTDLARRTATH